MPDAHEVRIVRNEEDIQRLFEKFGLVITLMYKVDKKLENWTGKVAGISFVVTALVVPLALFIFKSVSG